MRSGEMTATIKTNQTSPEELAELMVGRKVLLNVSKSVTKAGDIALEVKDLKVTDAKGVLRVKGITFNVREGEILGIAGVAGNGQSELLEALGGFRKSQGLVSVYGHSLDLESPSGQEIRDQSIAHVPEDRQRLGLIMDFTAWENIGFGYQHEPEYSNSWGLMNNRKMRKDASNKMKKFDVRPSNTKLKARNFSGGNQQKLVLAREIERNPDILLIGQPTRGVDIGAIEFIHNEIIKMRDEGKAIILVSVELDEILSLTDRVSVMFDGNLVGDRITSETNAMELGLLMGGETD
jgi:simple sugar transport system ATP-binding protein